ncbi:DUF2591 domain-containing protein [Cronobacter malonaticus]|uniref:phage protein NinX family protein n=1 Tax=Cronobacter malonaticus TaxID=413503 RepID=UPI0013761A61|nr:phage protein NinX family protein [Cronobacter malonaticus]NCH31143.1 DUF2591 domain-containing protein [Cronobacter malonaticus]
MDYSKLSDQEINGLVMDALSDGNQAYRNGDGSFIELLHQVNAVEFGEHVERDEVYATFDPCNKPADAWPIISKHRISIEFDGDNSTEPQTTWCHTTNLGRTIGTQYQKNPLRAAAIVFLMMQESRHA